jgi:hypothetical protein
MRKTKQMQIDALVQENESLRRQLSLSISTERLLEAEIAKLKNERVVRAPNTAVRLSVAEAARRYCQEHGVKSVPRDVLLAEMRA